MGYPAKSFISNIRPLYLSVFYVIARYNKSRSWCHQFDETKLSSFSSNSSIIPVKIKKILFQALSKINLRRIYFSNWILPYLTWNCVPPPIWSPTTSPPLHKVPQLGGTNLVVARYYLATNLCIGYNISWSIIGQWIARIHEKLAQ